MLGGKMRAYAIFIQKNLYLPKYKSKTITGNYLYSLSLKEIFSVRRDQIHPAYDYQNNSKLKLFEILVNDIKKTVFQLGFDQFKLPDKQWLVDIIFYMKPNHRMFKPGA